MSRKKLLKKEDLKDFTPVTVGDRINYIAANSGLTGGKFAKSLGISSGNLNGLINDDSKPSAAFCSRLFELYKVNLNWLLEKTDNFKMELEVITREEAERRKKAAAEPIYIDMSDPSATSDSVKTPAADPWREHLVKTRFILESKTGYANSLAANINSFYDAVVTADKLKDHENRLAQLEKLSTDGREKEGLPDTALAAAS